MNVVSAKGRFAPLSPDHPGVGTVCELCDVALAIGDVPALVEIGPDGDEETAKAEAGRPYRAACNIVHETCAFPEVDQ